MSKKPLGTGDKPQPLQLQRQGRAFGSGIDARVYIGGSGNGSGSGRGSGNAAGTGTGTGIGSTAHLKSPPIFSLVCHQYLTFAIPSSVRNAIWYIFSSFLLLE